MIKINKTIKYFRLISDLHVEFTEYFDLPSLPEDKETLLIIAGDFHVGTKGVPYLETLACQFGHVLYVFGNHEYYKHNFEYLHYSVMESLDTLFSSNKLEYNITVVSSVPELLEFDNLRVLAGTMWTNMNGSDPLTMMEVANALNDYHIIRNKTRKLVPQDTITVFHKTVNQFDKWLKEPFGNGKTIIVTHHLPSQGAVDPRYQGEDNFHLNGGYRSNLDDFIYEHQPDYWCFGHSHSTTRKEILNSTLISNPRGYPKRSSLKVKLADELDDTADFENPDFDPLFRIAV